MLKKTSMALFCILIFSFFSAETCMAADELTIIAPAIVEETESFVVTVFSNEIPIENATVIFNEENETTNSTGMAYFYAPEVENNVTHIITAFKEGYPNATANVTIINTPKKLEITIDETPGDDGKYRYQVDVYVSDDDGNLITGATVTFDDQTLTTTVNGKVIITVDSEITGTITATKDGYIDSDDFTITIVGSGGPNLLPIFVCPIIIIIILIISIIVVILAIKRKEEKQK